MIIIRIKELAQLKAQAEAAAAGAGLYRHPTTSTLNQPSHHAGSPIGEGLRRRASKSITAKTSVSPEDVIYFGVELQITKLQKLTKMAKLLKNGQVFCDVLSYEIDAPKACAPLDPRARSIQKPEQGSGISRPSTITFSATKKPTVSAKVEMNPSGISIDTWTIQGPDDSSPPKNWLPFEICIMEISEQGPPFRVQGHLVHLS